MESVKKSFNLDPVLAQQVEGFLEKNVGVSFTLIMNQALKDFLKNGVLRIELVHPKFTENDVDKFLSDNSELMDSLAK